MIDRRTFMSLLATAAVAPRSSFAQGTPGRVALYSSIGPVLTHYDVDVAGAELIKRATVTLPAAVQYAWPHASRRYLYVASSSSAPGYGTAGTEHHVTAFGIDPASGALTPHGAPIRLPTRPIHMTTDIPSGPADALDASETTLLTLEQETGVVRASIMRFVKGRQSLRLDMADKLAAHFGLELRSVGKDK